MLSYYCEEKKNEQKSNRRINKKFRRHRGITQKQLAKSIEKSESTIQKYESGEVEAPLSVLEQISDCLGLNVIELLEADSGNFVIEYWKKQTMLCLIFVNLSDMNL